MEQTDDQWGRDPQVKATRRMFAAMEKAQDAYLDSLDLDLWTPGLKQWRRLALELFGRAMPAMMRQGALRDEDQAGLLFVYCLVRVLTKERVPGAEEHLPPAEGFYDLAGEALS